MRKNTAKLYSFDLKTLDRFSLRCCGHFYNLFNFLLFVLMVDFLYTTDETDFVLRTGYKERILTNILVKFSGRKL